MVTKTNATTIRSPTKNSLFDSIYLSSLSSQASQIQSLSTSLWSGLYTKGQLSNQSGTPSPSISLHTSQIPSAFESSWSGL
jgi:hypothetical protein